MSGLGESTTGIDLNYLQQWVRKYPVSLTEKLDLRTAQRLGAILDQTYDFKTGDALPPLWQWVYFTSSPLASELGADGHPARGGFLPPVSLTRRMWASSSIRFQAPLILGETVRKQSRVASVTLKQGSAGPLVFVDVEHEYSVENDLRVMESQKLVYVGRVGAAQPTEEVKLYTEQFDWSETIQPDPVLLFRYSAITANTHRIHYDRNYAMDEEGHPGLVVHGPLTATLLAELMRKSCPDEKLTEFSFRALRPLLDSQPFTIHGKRGEDGTVSLWALDVKGQLAVQATAMLKNA